MSEPRDTDPAGYAKGDPRRNDVVMGAAAMGFDNTKIELAKWWEKKADEEIERTLPKVAAYGATDLEEIGRKLQAAGVKIPRGEPGSPRTPQLIEAGIYFYIVGKMARWADAVARGDTVSDDTLFDIGVYVRMVQRVRQVGGWPSAREHQAR
jgi:hypothetical protein